ncbi:MAG: hypothetical protein GY953_11395, partial [bacterium]|nr:hypothetical protein [bacterium]
IRPPASAIPEAGDELVRRSVLDFTGTDERVAGEPPIDEEEPIPVAEIYRQEPVYAMPEAQPAPAPANGLGNELTTFQPMLLEADNARPGVMEMMSRDLALRDDYGRIIDYLNTVRDPGQGIAIGLAPEIGPEEAAVAAVEMAYSLQRRNGLPVLLVDAACGQQPLAAFFGFQEARGLRELLAGPPGHEKQCIHRTGFGELWILPEGSRHWSVNPPAARVASLHKARANGSMNLIVHLPDGAKGGVPMMLYSIMDAVLSSLKREDVSGENATELVRRVV